MCFHQCNGSGDEYFNGCHARVVELLPAVAGESAEPNLFFKIHLVELTLCIFGGEVA